MPTFMLNESISMYIEYNVHIQKGWLNTWVNTCS